MSTETLERAFADARAILANIKPEQLSAPTPCQSWQVRDVINHVIGVSFFAADAMNMGTATSPSDADFSSGDMLASYDDGIGQAVAAFGAPGAQEKVMAGNDFQAAIVQALYDAVVKFRESMGTAQ